MNGRLSFIEAVVLLVLATMLLAPFTCWRKASETRGRTVTLWFQGGPEDTAFIQELGREFASQHKDANIIVKPFPAASQFSRKLLLSMQAGSCGDVVLCHVGFIPEYAAKGVLEPLDEYAARDMDLSDFFPGALQSYRYQGKLYAIPSRGSTMTLFYNKNLFDAAGVSYPNDNWTWDDFLAAAQKLTVRDKDGRLMQVGCSPYDFSSWIWSAGGELGSEDGSRILFTDPKTVAGVQFYVDLRNKYRVTTENMSATGTDPTSVNVFEKGRVAMEISGPWMLSKYIHINDFQWDVALFPKGPGGRQTRYAGTGFFIWKGSKQKELAWELVKFLSSPAAEHLLARGGSDVPTRRSVARDPVFLRPDEPWDMSAFLRAQEPPSVVRMTPRTPDWPPLQSVFDEYFDQALIGKTTVEDAMKQAQSFAEYIQAHPR